VDEASTGALEAAVADAGALLLRAEKYCRGAGPDGVTLRRVVLSLGDRARRLHRREALDPAAAEELRAEAEAVVARLHAFVREIAEAPEYRAAVAAHGAGDHLALARLLPTIFAGLEPVITPGDLFYPVASRRRGRPLLPSQIAAAVVDLSRQGLEAKGDDLSAGTDPALPAVILYDQPPADEPVVLRFAPGAVPAPIYRLADTGEHLIYAVNLRAPFRVVLRPPDPEMDDPYGETPQAREALAAALAATGVVVEQPLG
jgi:hypothetical protein